MIMFINLFSKFKDKIIYILVDKLPPGLHQIDKIEDKNTRGNRIIDNTLMIEHNQRNTILKGLVRLTTSEIEYVEDRLGHDWRYAMDITKIEDELGWYPKISFEEAMKMVLPDSGSTKNWDLKIVKLSP